MLDGCDVGPGGLGRYAVGEHVRLSARMAIEHYRHGFLEKETSYKEHVRYFLQMTPEHEMAYFILKVKVGKKEDTDYWLDGLDDEKKKNVINEIKKEKIKEEAEEAKKKKTGEKPPPTTEEPAETEEEYEEPSVD